MNLPSTSGGQSRTIKESLYFGSSLDSHNQLLKEQLLTPVPGVGDFGKCSLALREITVSPGVKFSFKLYMYIYIQVCIL